ncbi:integrase catalytic domain-containing protein [Trichonephila clavipes]|nr:integrase catalytic domain-containing protein [Trichonephila clavipes]
MIALEQCGPPGIRSIIQGAMENKKMIRWSLNNVRGSTQSLNPFKRGLTQIPNTDVSILVQDHLIEIPRSVINFRLNKIAFCSDIKQAFLQICLADKHKDAVRFLWSDHEPCVHKKPKLQVYCFNRVNFGISSSPFLLAAIYLRTKSRNGISVKLVTSKSRVAPLNCVTLPRLELLGALVAARLASKLEHARLFHAGPQGLLNAVRQNFWPLSGRTIARKTVHQCVTCFKSRPILSSQIMGNLPSERVNISSPFTIAGLDLCGPFLVKYKNQRKGTLNKVYIGVCICFSTKAIHLELLSDLTSDALIATLKRFTSRRGKCSKIYTDNATNFVGANSILKKFHKLINFLDENLAKYFVSETIEWEFIPPKSPHFGGL